jgi:hypothetical protein
MSGSPQGVRGDALWADADADAMTMNAVRTQANAENSLVITQLLQADRKPERH